MSLGDVTLIVSALLAAFAAATSIMRLMGNQVKPWLPRALTIMGAIAALVSLAFLITIFMSEDLDYEIVHQYSSADMPVVYKLSGSWAGQAGSMIFWTTIIMVAWGVEEARWWRRSKLGTEPRDEPRDPNGAEDDGGKGRKGRRGRKGRSHQQRRTLASKVADRMARRPEGWATLDIVRAVLMLVVLLMLTATMALDPFGDRTSLLPAGGRGLNPALRTPLMAIHPPIVFIAYALMTITFAASMAYVLRRDRRWVEISKQWTRGAWFMLTLGIGLGGMWAYETLGWGGYWAWDPVETSSFLPWIALTAFMHAQVQHERRGEYRHLAPFLAGIGLFLVLYATFVTRSGVWSSVHAYATSATGSVLERAGEVIIEQPSIFWIFVTMWFVLLATLFPAVWRLSKAKDEEPLLERGEDESTLEWLADPKVTMFATIALLTISMALLLLMLTISAGSSISQDMYHARVAVFAVLLMAVLIICMAFRVLDRRRATLTAFAAVAAGVVTAVINPGDVDPAIAWFGAVLGLFAIVVIIWDGATHVWANRRSPRRLLKRVGSIMLHLGLAMVFMAYCLSNVPVLAEDQGQTVTWDQAVELEGWDVTIHDRSWQRDTGDDDRNENWDTFKGRIELSRDGDVAATENVEFISMYQYRAYGTYSYKVDGVDTTIDGEAVNYQVTSEGTYAWVEELFPPSPDVPPKSAVVLVYPGSFTPWPALENDAENLTGYYFRISSDAGQSWEGFLVSVEAMGGNVTLTSGSGEVVIPRSDVDTLSRRAQVQFVMTDVFIHSTVTKDVYVTIVSAQPLPDGTFSAKVMVREIPAMMFLWSGMYLMAAGVVLRPLERLKGDGGRSKGKREEERPIEDEEQEEEEASE